MPWASAYARTRACRCDWRPVRWRCRQASGRAAPKSRPPLSAPLSLRVEPVEVPEIAVRRVDPLASEQDLPATQQIRPNRLRVTAYQPRRRTIGRNGIGGYVVAHRVSPRRLQVGER